MLTGSEKLEAHLGMARVGRANDHAVHLAQRLFVSEELLTRAKQRHALVPLSEQRLALKLEVEELGSGGLFTALHDGCDLGIRVAKKVRQMPALRPPCSADDGYPCRLAASEYSYMRLGAAAPARKRSAPPLSSAEPMEEKSRSKLPSTASKRRSISAASSSPPASAAHVAPSFRGLTGPDEARRA